jgi:hypothetical protein
LQGCQEESGIEWKPVGRDTFAPSNIQLGMLRDCKAVRNSEELCMNQLGRGGLFAPSNMKVAKLKDGKAVRRCGIQREPVGRGTFAPSNIQLGMLRDCKAVRWGRNSRSSSLSQLFHSRLRQVNDCRQLSCGSPAAIFSGAHPRFRSCSPVS